MRYLVLRAMLALVGIAILTGCNKPAGSGSMAAGNGADKQLIPEVDVVEVNSQSLPITRELVGRLAATRSAQVRARVAGVLLERAYTEGTDVHPGQVLFRIDPTHLQAQLSAQEAALAKAEADATNARLMANRYRELRDKKTLSQQDLDTAQAAERTTAAAVKQAQANVEAARIDLGYATVTAPIAGRAGRALVTEGTLVGQGEATLLTTVERIDPIYANFSQSLSELAGLRKAAAAGARTGSGPRVEVLMPDGTPYAQAGKLDFSDLAVDPGTGALSLRATLPNPDKVLLPGMFVTLRLAVETLDHAFLVPKPALAWDAKGPYLLLVDDTGKVIQRRVKSHSMTRTAWIVTGDLKDGDQVIVAGIQKAKPGDVVRPSMAVADGPSAGEQPAIDQPAGDPPQSARRTGVAPSISGSSLPSRPKD